MCHQREDQSNKNALRRSQVSGGEEKRFAYCKNKEDFHIREDPTNESIRTTGVKKKESIGERMLLSTKSCN